MGLGKHPAAVDIYASIPLIAVRVDGDGSIPAIARISPRYHSNSPRLDFVSYDAGSDSRKSGSAIHVEYAEESESEEYYSLRNGTRVAVLWILVVILSLWALCSDGITDFLAFGPTKSPVVFGKFQVNTWPKWMCLMLYASTSQMAMSYVDKTLNPFFCNVIRDHKSTVWQHKEKEAAALTMVYKLFYWVIDVLDLLLTLTLQVQFYIPAITVDVIIATMLTVKNVRGKASFGDEM